MRAKSHSGRGTAIPRLTQQDWSDSDEETVPPADAYSKLLKGLHVNATKRREKPARASKRQKLDRQAVNKVQARREASHDSKFLALLWLVRTDCTMLAVISGCFDFLVEMKILGLDAYTHDRPLSPVKGSCKLQSSSLFYLLTLLTLPFQKRAHASQLFDTQKESMANLLIYLFMISHGAEFSRTFRMYSNAKNQLCLWRKTSWMIMLEGKLQPCNAAHEHILKGSDTGESALLHVDITLGSSHRFIRHRMNRVKALLQWCLGSKLCKRVQGMLLEDVLGCLTRLFWGWVQSKLHI